MVPLPGPMCRTGLPRMRCEPGCREVWGVPAVAVSCTWLTSEAFLNRTSPVSDPGSLSRKTDLGL